MRRAVVIVCLGLAVLLSSRVSSGQTQTPAAVAPAASTPAAFEVASIKLSDPNASGPFGAVPIVLPQGGGRFTANNIPLRLLVRLAYGVQDFQIAGGPSWQLTQKFDVVAKAEEGTVSNTQLLLPMVKTLLIDRFKLKAHMETRELPVSTLLVAREDGKLGPNLKPSASTDCSQAQAEQARRAEAFLKGGPGAVLPTLPKPGENVPCAIVPAAGPDGFGLKGNGQSLNVLVQLLVQATGHIVQDKTGLTGLYDFELRFDPEVLMRMASQAGVNLPPGLTLPPSDNPSLLTAIREQLGLKLDTGKGPVEVLVIDSAEMPTSD